MKQTVNEHDFREAFRTIRPENFSYEGLNSLFEYLEEAERDMGKEMELDVIAICCDYSEYADLDEFRADYGDDYETIQDIEADTTVIRIDDTSFIIQAF